MKKRGLNKDVYKGIHAEKPPHMEWSGLSAISLTV